MGDLERIIARRSELGVLAKELTKQLQKIQAEREELLVAERILKPAGRAGPGRSGGSRSRLPSARAGGGKAGSADPAPWRGP